MADATTITRIASLPKELQLIIYDDVLEAPFLQYPVPPTGFARAVLKGMVQFDPRLQKRFYPSCVFVCDISQQPEAVLRWFDEVDDGKVRDIRKVRLIFYYYGEARPSAITIDITALATSAASAAPTMIHSSLQIPGSGVSEGFINTKARCKTKQTLITIFKNRVRRVTEGRWNATDWKHIIRSVCRNSGSEGLEGPGRERYAPHRPAQVLADRRSFGSMRLGDL